MMRKTPMKRKPKRRVAHTMRAPRKNLRKNVPHAYSLAERLEYYSIPEPNSGCVLWLANVTSRGYGKLRCKNVTYSTHRAAFELAKGPIPDGLFVCHKCDVPSCINPAHLFLGTHEENMADRDAKKRHSHHERHGMAKIDLATAAKIFASKGFQRDIAKLFGVSQTTVWFIKSGRHWKGAATFSPEGAAALRAWGRDE
jgi:hypothetical protein